MAILFLPGHNASELKELLVDEVLTEADWRAQKAAEYPTHHRHHRVAEALRELAASLERMPTPCFARYARALDALFSIGRYDVEIAIHCDALRRYGFNEVFPQGGREFLDELSSQIEKEIAFAGEAGR